MVPLRRFLPCIAVMVGCHRSLPVEKGADAQGFTAPTPATLAAQEAAQKALPADDGSDRAEAERGLVGRETSLRVAQADGTTAFDQDAFAFVRGEPPGSVNPSLWRQASLNDLHGLYEVGKGVYQLRGYDLANLSLIEGKTGWIVVDPLTTRETATRALAFANEKLGKRPVSAVIFTHSHIDHFGGAHGVATPEDVAAGRVQVVAPEGFLEEATSENVLAGPAMARRAMYMYGMPLPRTPRGKVDNGLGKEPALGTLGILPPRTLVGFSTRTLEVDGVPMEFQYTPGSEAPAELTFYLPAQKAFCGAEVLSRTLHNLYTLRGAKIRDARRWAGYIDEALERFPETEVLFLSHHWPVWGRERVATFMKEQRDTYLYVHDQTLRLANQGFGPREIAEQIAFPASLSKHYWNRGYYGTLRHDARAVYQMYFGFYDATPASLDPLPRAESARRTVEYMGGGAALLAKARASFEKGEYRWVAEVVQHLVFAEPSNAEAKALLASAYDQLGYVAESSAWRNAYLTGAYELRHGGPEEGVSPARAAGILEHAAPEHLLQTFQVALNGPKADGVSLTLNFTFPDVGETWVLTLENAVLHAKKRPAVDTASASLTITRAMLVKVLTKQAELKDILTSPEITVSGSTLDLLRFFTLLDRPDLRFPIVTLRD